MNVKLKLEAIDAAALQTLCGAGNRTIRRIEQHFDVRFLGAPGNWQIEGEQAEAAAASVRRLAVLAESGDITRVDIESTMANQEPRAGAEENEAPDSAADSGPLLIAGRRHVRGKTANQSRYLESIAKHVLTLAVGPAGSGKTYLAVAAAVVALQSHEVERIILTRPAVEAGERLGFLPGDLQQKIDPYLRPLFDALVDMLGIEKMNALMESGRIEIAPLAYMRGRTLNDAFVILDEAQNTTREQMKMFVTRLGFGSKMVITGDATQIDLERKHHSGLVHALEVLGAVRDIGVCRLSGKDVVRHRLVEKIVAAYDAADSKRESKQEKGSR